MHFPLDTFHNLIVLSQDPDAKYFPSREKTTLVTELEWPVRIFMGFPLGTSHNSIVQSVDPDAKYFSSLENTTLVTPPEWPLRVLRTCRSLIFFFPKYIL